MRMIGVFCAAALVLGTSISTADAAYVCRLNVRGDNFASLRTGPSRKSDEIERLATNTFVTIIGAQKRWRNVRTSTGTAGWVYSRFICL